MVIQPGAYEHTTDTWFRRGPGFPYWTLGIFLNGHTLFTSGKKSVRIEPGWFGVLEPNTPYRAETGPGVREIWCFCTLRNPFVRLIRTWPSAFSQHYLVQFSRSRQGSEIVRLMQELPAIVRASFSDAGLFAENTLERIILLVNEAHADNTRPPLDERVSGAMTFLSANFQRQLSLATLAGHVHASPSRLSHLFREQTGKTPMAFLEHHRIQEAIRLLLSTNMRIREVAEAVGYANPYHFCVRFKINTGMAPRDFRRPPGKQG